MDLDSFIAHSGLIYDKKGREVLRKIYNEYISIGQEHNLPFMSLAPTWRANPERINKSVFYNYKNINRDCVDFLNEIRRNYSSYSKSIMIGGMMAYKGDAYRPEEALSKEAATKFHSEQAKALANSDLDFIKAATLPAVSEAYGIASAISVHRIPYILSFVNRADGSILDGTPLHKAIDLIDSEIHPEPVFYMVNCVYPTLFEQAIIHNIIISENITDRILGFQANTSAKNPEELDDLSYLDTSDPEEFSDLMISLQKRFGIKV
ncbi:homocysteine S-methyltransferase family protein [Thermodesulfobacteriota bacterium]